MQGDRGAGERADQGKPGPAALPVAWSGEGRRRVAPVCYLTQPAEVVQTQAITAADAVGSHGMKGHGPGSGSQG